MASETMLSWISAEIIKEQLETEGYVVHFEVVSGLQVKDALRFEKEGLVNFIDRVWYFSNGGYNGVLNVTGGYKALIPYATILAQLYQMPMYYLFGDTFSAQESYPLIRFPQAPLAIDWSTFEKYASVIRIYTQESTIGKSTNESITLATTSVPVFLRRMEKMPS